MRKEDLIKSSGISSNHINQSSQSSSPISNSINNSSTMSNNTSITDSSMETSSSLSSDLSISTRVGNLSKINLEFVPIENLIIQVMFTRIDNILPYKSRFSYDQVLADPTYIQVKSHLLKLSFNQNYLNDLVSSIYNLLIKILKADDINSKSLYDKSVNTLNSLYVVINLLASFLNHLKSNDTLSQLNGSIFSRGGMKTTTTTMFKTHLSSTPTSILSENLCTKLLSLLLSFKNDSTCLTTLFKITEPTHSISLSTSKLNSINHNPLSPTEFLTADSISKAASTSYTPISELSKTSSLIDESSSSSGNDNNNTIDNTSTSLDDFNEIKKLLLQKSKLKSYEIVSIIDESVSSILLYIAATNQSQYLNFEKLIFKHINVESLYIKGSHLIQFSFITTAKFNANIQFIKDILHITKRNSQRSLLLHFFTESILSWAIYRTNDFIKAPDHSLCSKNAEILFDFLYKQIDYKYCPRIYYGILSCLLLLQPKQITKFINEKSNKSTTQAIKRSISSVAKLNSNKQKFLSDFTQLINKNPDAAQPLISFLLIGCSVGSIDKSHPLYQFVLFLKDPLLKQLNIDLYDTNTAGQSHSFLHHNNNTSHHHHHHSHNNTSSSSNSNNLQTNFLHLPSFTSSSGSSFSDDKNSHSPTSLNNKNLSLSSNSSLSSEDYESNHNNDTDSISNENNKKIIHELKIGVFAINAIVNMDILPKTLNRLLKSSKDSSDLLSLFTGSLRMLILTSSLSDKIFQIIQDLSDSLIKIMSLICKRLNNMRIKNELIKNRKEGISSPSSNPFDDSGSLNSTSSELSDDSEPLLPNFKLTDQETNLGNDIKYNLIERKINKYDFATLKECLINLLIIYSSYPFLCYPTVERDPNNPDFVTFEKIFRKLMSRVVSLLYLDDDEIFSATESLLLNFCITVANNVPIRVFVAYVGSSIMIDSVSSVGISANITNEKRNRIIRLVLDLLEKRSENSDLKLMYENRHIIDSFHGRNFCRRIITNFEKIVFLGLFSSNLETIRISKRLLQFYVFVITNNHHHKDCFDNSNLQLATNILGDKMTFGIVSIKKKLRDHLCQLMKPTSTLITIWQLMYEKVAIVYDYQNGPTLNSSDKEIDKFFETHVIVEDMEIYCEYLASLGGIILSKEFKDDPRQPIYLKNLQRFISNKFISLFTKDVKKREHAREILSVSNHPYLSELILTQIERFLPKFEINLKNGEFNTCEIFLSVLRSIIQLESESLFMIAVDLWNVNYKLMKMFNVENTSPDFLRLKLKFCKLQVIFLQKLNELSLNGNIMTKNQYARITADYLETSFDLDSVKKPRTRVLTFSTKSNSNSNINNANVKKMSSKIKEFQESELKDLLMDIRVEVSVMLKIIFYKLPLDTPRHNYGGSDDDKSTASVVFSNYFNLFVRLLEKLNEMKNSQNETTFNVMTHNSSNIIKEVIQALVNLLNANSKIGLKYSLPLGYHTDELIRISFIDVFSNIIKNISMRFEKVVSRTTLFIGATDLFIDDYDLFLAAASCCPNSKIEAYASAINQLKINERHKLKLIISLIKYDILHTFDKNEILRSNTIGTRVIALYSYDNAKQYLISIFRPIFEEMLNSSEFFEIERVNEDDTRTKEENIKLFFKYLNLIADSLYDSVENMPTGIRLIAKTIFDTTAEVLHDSKYTSINAYLFLRLINPTIVAPERSDIIDSPNLKFKRSLVQLAKVIQTIVNESAVRLPLIEDKLDELSYAKGKFFEFMKKVVDFNMEEKFNSIEIDEIDEQYERGIRIEREILSMKYDESNSGIFLHGFFYSNWMEIRKAYLSQSFGYDITLESKIETIKKMDFILANTGLPRRVRGYEIPETVKDDKSPKGILLYDLMSRTNLTLSDVTFIKVLITKDGLPLICINTLEFPEDLTPEKYIYNLLQTLTKFWETPYCMLMDATAFNNFELFERGRDIVRSIVPDKYVENCKRVYYMNMSSKFFEVFKRLEIASTDSHVNSEYIFLSTNDDSRTLSKNKLIGYFNPVSHDSRVTFHDVSIYQEESNRFVPVKLKIGNQFVQVTSALPQRIKLVNKMHIINMVDCYKINELIDISPSSFTGVANEISMIDMKTNKRIIFTSTKKIEIMRTLYFSKARLNNNGNLFTGNNEDAFIGSNNDSLVGQLLNISFSGLLSKSDEVRKSSYSLLSSIQQSVGLKTDKVIEHIEGVIFPYGDIDYICDVSNSIAVNHPNLSYSFLYGFFTSFEKLDVENKKSMVLCISPWVKNIYKNIYLSHSVGGPARTNDLIRKFVRASRDENNYQVFSVFIWPQLSLEDGLIEIIIDEIVAASIDHEAEGHDWFRITRYWPLRSSVEICSVIIGRMKEKSYTMKHNESEIEAHTRWIETTVLARFLSYLVFDSLIFIDRYIGDIFYIVTIYMDYGPLELRKCLLNLLTRTFHSYLSKPTLTAEQHLLIKDQIELLNGARFRMLFGLTREDDRKINENDGFDIEVSNRSVAIITLCDLLTKFLKNDVNPEDYILQMIKWSSCICKIAFDSELQLQNRAILILGSISKQGISGMLLLKILELLRKVGLQYVDSNDAPILSKNLNLMVCSLHAFEQTIQGVNYKSIFNPLMFWFHLTVILTDNITFYKYGARYIKITISKFSEHCKEENIKMIDYIFDSRKMLIEYVDAIEREFVFKITRENFDSILILICCKGLETPFTHSEAVAAIKELLKVRYYESKMDKNDDNYKCYLFFLFLTCTSNEDLMEAMEECGFENIEFIIGNNNCMIPKLLIEWFEKPNLNVYTTCIGASNYFMKLKLDEIATSRVITLYVELFKTNPDFVVELFSNDEQVLKKFVLSSTTSNLLEKVLDMVVQLMNNNKYSENLTKGKIREASEFAGIIDSKFSTTKVNIEGVSVVPLETKKRRFKILDDLLENIGEIYKDSLRTDDGGII